MAYILPDTQLLTVKQVAEQGNSATFELEPLSPGFGITVGNALRRILLSSIEGAAVSSIRLDGGSHEFTTIPGVREDLVSVSLNIKQLRMRVHGNEPVSLVLQKKGPGAVTAADFKANAAVEFIDPTHVIATLDKGATFNLEVEVRKGRGYSSTDSRRDEKLPLGTIAVDSIFTPIVRVNYEVENTRVGNITNYDKVVMTITTDGSMTPQEAMQTAAKIAVEHFSIIAGMYGELPTDKEMIATAVDTTMEEMAEAAPKKRAPRTKKTTETES